MRIDSPSLSICIATKNRQKYAASAIRSLLKYSREDFEIIVSDDSDDCNVLISLISDISDHRLRCIATEHRLSSIDNFRLTIEKSDGKYLCLIGDDDTVLPDIFEALDFALKNNVDCISGNLSLNYRWPGTGIKKTIFTNTDVGGLTIASSSGKYKFIDPLNSVNRLLLNGGVDYIKLPFPKFYHGLVKRDCLNAIKSATGNYLGGLSPDIYTAVALSFVAKTVLVIDAPLTMPGVCGESTTVTEGNNKSVGVTFRAAPHFRLRENYVQSPLIPDIYCLETIWADSCLAAIKDMGREDLTKEFSKVTLVAHILSKYPELKAKCIDSIVVANKNRTNPFLSVFSLYSLAVIVFVKRLSVRAINRFMMVSRVRPDHKIDDIVDIEQALLEYGRLYSVNKRLFNKIKPPK